MITLKIKTKNWSNPRNGELFKKLRNRTPTKGSSQLKNRNWKIEPLNTVWNFSTTKFLTSDDLYWPRKEFFQDRRRIKFFIPYSNLLASKLGRLTLNLKNWKLNQEFGLKFQGISKKIDYHYIALKHELK